LAAGLLIYSPLYVRHIVNRLLIIGNMLLIFLISALTGTGVGDAGIGRVRDCNF